MKMTKRIVQKLSLLGLFLIAQYTTAQTGCPDTPTITLSSSVNNDLINPYDEVTLVLTWEGKSGDYGSYNIELNNGHKFYIYMGSNQSSVYKIRPDTTTIYEIKSAIEQRCGAALTKGQVAVRVNSSSLRVLRTHPAGVCAGSPLLVEFSQATPASAGNSFKVEILNKQNEIVQTIANAGTQSPLTITPASRLKEDTYKLRLVASQPALTSPAIDVFINDSPSLSISPAASTTVSWGNQLPIDINFTGKAPFTFELSDGTVSKPDEIFNSKNYGIFVRPDASQNITVKSFSTACANVGVASGSVSANVVAGLKVMTDKTPTKICEGATMTIPVETKGTFGGDNQFTFILTYFGDDFYSMPPTYKMRIPVTLVNNQFSVKLPTGLPMQHYAWPSFQIESSNPKAVFEGPNFALGSAPRVSGMTRVDNYNNVAWINVNGMPPVEMNLSDGTTITLNEFAEGIYTHQFPTRATTIYSVTSVKNVCGVGTLPADNAIKVENPNPIIISAKQESLPTNGVCAGSSVSLAFTASGATTPDTEYTIEYGWPNNVVGNFFISQGFLGKSKTSPITIPLPKDMPAGRYLLRVVASNPASLSGFVELEVNTLTELKTEFRSDKYTPPLAVVGGDYLGASQIYVTGGSQADITLSNNTKISLNDHGGAGYSLRDIVLDKPGKYFIKDVRNICGVGKVSYTDTIYAYPFVMKPPAFDLIWNNGCAGQRLSIPFQLLGTPPADVEYTVQFSRNSSFKPFYDLPTQLLDKRTVVVTLPDTLAVSKARSWDSSNGPFLRIVAKKNGVIENYIVETRIIKPITATLTSPSAVNGITTYDPSAGGAALNLNFRGSPVWYGYINNVKYDERNIGMYGDNYYTNPEGVVTLGVRPTKRTTYSIKQIENACGYGPFSGTIAVIVKPTTQLALIGNNDAVCRGGVINLDFNSAGDFGADNRFTVLIAPANNPSQTRELKQLVLSSGRLDITLPNDLTEGNYQVFIKASDPNTVVSNSVNIRIISPATATISGSNTINTGQIATIRLIANGGSPYKYELSDGTKGTIYGTTDIDVTPTKTTTYTLASIQNACGMGQVTGKATITINPASSSSIFIDDNQLYDRAICVGKPLSVPYLVKGTLPVGTLSVQVSDANGENFKTVPTTGMASPLIATIPRDLPMGDGYRVRVVHADNSVSCAANRLLLSVRYAPTASLSGPTFYQPGQSIALQVTITGDPSWYIELGDSTRPYNYYVSQSPYTINVFPTGRNNTYTLFKVSNAVCGVGTISNSTLKVELLTSNGLLVNEEILLYPNPTTDYVYLKLPPTVSTVELYDVSGRLVRSLPPSALLTIPLMGLSAGEYFFKVQSKSKSQMLRFVKI
jgi:hypothetical protein